MFIPGPSADTTAFTGQGDQLLKVNRLVIDGLWFDRTYPSQLKLEAGVRTFFKLTCCFMQLEPGLLPNPGSAAFQRDTSVNTAA